MLFKRHSCIPPLLIVVLSFTVFFSSILEGKQKVTVGMDVLLKEEQYHKHLSGKRIGLITNHTAINGDLKSSIELMKQETDWKLTALFAPEHGIYGLEHAEKIIKDSRHETGVPIYSLHGASRRPTDEMLSHVDVLVFDIQDIGSRSYTYNTTLFYAMEEAAKKGIKVIVTDRPNPLGGTIVDGLLLDQKLRSFVGYINVPYCHGMTIGELALFFNKEYKVGCELVVVPMRGWKRTMTFFDTGLHWIPTSPQIPEPDSPFFYPATGILGELQVANIGVGYTLPFKVVGAPWINAVEFSEKLNELHFPGVLFLPFYYKPFFGSLKDQECQGVKIIITDPKAFSPVSTQYLIIGIMKSLYPKQFQDALKAMGKRKEMFNKVNGNEEVYRIISEEKYAVFELKKLCQRDREKFLPIRKQYLIYD